MGRAMGSEFCIHRVDIVVVVYVYELGGTARREHGRKEIVVQYTQYYEQANARGDEVISYTAVFHC